MINPSNLFCTPEQGLRLQELVPELKYELEWFKDKNGDIKPNPIERLSNGEPYYADIFSPALTLQELRDVVWGNDIGLSFILEEFQHRLLYQNAPELATWVIDRLGGMEK